MGVCNKDKGVVGWCKGIVYLTSPGIQLILAYNLARPAILLISSVSSLPFLFLFLPCPSLSSLVLSYLFSPFLWETTQNDPKGLRC